MAGAILDVSRVVYVDVSRKMLCPILLYYVCAISYFFSQACAQDSFGFIPWVRAALVFFVRSSSSTPLSKFGPLRVLRAPRAICGVARSEPLRCLIQAEPRHLAASIFATPRCRCSAWFSLAPSLAGFRTPSPAGFISPIIDRYAKPKCRPPGVQFQAGSG